MAMDSGMLMFHAPRAAVRDCSGVPSACTGGWLAEA